MRPLRFMQGWGSALVAYPVAERREKRDVRSKLSELRIYYQQDFAERKKLAAKRLVEIVQFAASEVPYYRDLFKAKNIDPDKLEKDSGYLQEIPFLTKDIIREQGERLLSKSRNETRHHICRTGGSTGASCYIFYDQEAADYSAAVTLFAREQVGKKKHMFELHFASRFPETHAFKDRMREHLKCLAMNRYNIFFDRLDDEGLEEIWQELRRRKPHMAHGHPSTMYALACYIERTRGRAQAFDIFESSGELLEPYMREKIAQILQCRVIDRYGLAEFGVIAYQNGHDEQLRLFDSEGWIESAPQQQDGHLPEIIFTGFRNKLMPLIRLRTGDCGHIAESGNGITLGQMLGRIHDMVSINGTTYATHYVQDMLGKVGGVQEFQIDARVSPPRLLIVPEQGADTVQMEMRLKQWWKDGFQIQFGDLSDLVRVGYRDKFRHIITGTV